jgi:hypothetical protein
MPDLNPAEQKDRQALHPHISRSKLLRQPFCHIFNFKDPNCPDLIAIFSAVGICASVSQMIVSADSHLSKFQGLTDGR